MSAFTQEDGVENVNSTLKSKDAGKDYISLNAQLEQWGTNPDGTTFVQYDKDRESARQFFLNHVNPNMYSTLDLEEKIRFLIDEEYYEEEFIRKYDWNFVKELYKETYAAKFRFATFVGAYKFYTSYALKTFDGKRYLERFEDRVVATALFIADGNEEFARNLAREIISGRFQPATPTFLNAGKKQRGELVSCFLLNVEDNLNSIMRAVNSAAQLSKRGGGVALNLTNIRGKGDPIKKIENQASGVIPVMKILEDTFSYANQLGARQGAGAVYLNAHHIDIEDFLDTKRENADEKTRIKTLSLGVVIPDITFELARKGEKMYLFSPHDLNSVYGKEMAWLTISDIYREAVENPNIRKKSIDPRDFLSTLAEIQMESGYPYIIFEDAVNRANNVPGKINMSNLCVEIVQPQEESILNDDQTFAQIGKDISCNLGSLNIQKALESPNLGTTVETAIRTLTQVSDMSYIDAVPTVAEGNRRSHAVGLGAMNLHGSFAKNHMYFGDEESLDLTSTYFYVVLYHAIRASNLIATEKGETFDGFWESKYASGEFFNKYINPEFAFGPQTQKVKTIVEENGIYIPTTEDWKTLAGLVGKHGIYNQNLQAIPPTGSISYVNNSTPSTLPATFTLIEKRTEGKIGSVYVPNTYAEGNEEYYSGHNMFEVDAKHVIDVNSIVQYYVDQAISLTLGYKSTVTTKDVTKNILYAFSKGKPSAKALDERGELLARYPHAEIKSLYYVRVNNVGLEGTLDETCVSCAL
jgi:ribonucleoside-diphosphate reductase alpha chain